MVFVSTSFVLSPTKGLHTPFMGFLFFNIAKLGELQAWHFILFFDKLCHR
jgi:hypothetical protein